MSSTNYTKPLATLLRDSTIEAHNQVAASDGAKRLLSGRLSREEYVRYLMMLWHIYSAFEKALDKHATNPSLEPTYNPTLLARAPALSADIGHLLQVDEASWKTHPLHVRLEAAAPPPFTNYVKRIEALSNSADPSPLLAHAYVRYLGDLSGGQTIRHILAKAYDLDEASGTGVEFYAFKELRSAKPANQGEMKRIKEWFRAGMNRASEQQSLEAKAAVVEEAKTAFILNAGLFTALNDTIEKLPDASSREVLVATSQEAEKTYPISQVLSVIAAVCIAHFILVVGGFTGQRGYDKLLAVEQWIGDLFQQTK